MWEPAEGDTVPPPSGLTAIVNVYWIFGKFAVMVWSPDIVTVVITLFGSVTGPDQLSNLKPEAGVAATVTTVPSS